MRSILIHSSLAFAHAGALIGAVAVSFALTSCGSRDLSQASEQVFPAHFSSIRDRILVPRCSNCHAGIVSYKGVLKEIVKAGDPDNSLLYTEVKSGGMPRYSTKLQDAEVAAIYSWVKGGAQND